MKLFLHFLGTLFCYALLDLVFINVLAKGFIHRQVGWLLAPSPDWKAGLLFYLVFTAGLLYFCVGPAGSAGRAVTNGAFFGLVTYATYELVNKALLDRWPWPLVGVDLLWGVCLGAIVSWASWRLGHALPEY